jgi:polysaccharide pyruvyl transferase WcaK-like protein
LDETFGEQTLYETASFGLEDAVREQALQEPFARVRHDWLKPKGRCNSDYVKYQMNRFLGTRLQCCCTYMVSLSPEPGAALQVGGDNYSFDYGYPRAFMELDCQLLKRGIPLVLWGASVGPFSSDRRFEKEMARHLSLFSLITVREGRSFRYLQDLGLENVAHVADPAFVMPAEPVTDLELPEDFIGLNFSPMTARAAAGGDINLFARMCAQSVLAVLKRLPYPVLLVPHVSSHKITNDDFSFLMAVAEIAGMPERVSVLSPRYGAARVKGVIAKARLFAGARTHATIAALSSLVPTLSLAYSVKAWGINEDVFGHSDYCLDVKRLKQPALLADQLAGVEENRKAIVGRLESSIPAMCASAFGAGRQLKQVLEA